MSLKKVVVIAQDHAEPFGLGSLCEVWAEPYHPEDDNPVFDFHVVTPRPGRLSSRSGFDLVIEEGLEEAADADLVAVAPKKNFTEIDPAVTATLRAAYDRGAWVFGHCSGVFELGAAGLLDGKRCTTHWRYSERLQRTYPSAKVDADVLYVVEDNMITGAGSAASLDASLHLLRLEYGAAIASTAARRMVVPPQRDGGQAQFIAQAVPECDAETLGPLLAWIMENLHEPLDVATLAQRSLMSPRTFARRFRAETGATPHAWITSQRVRRAEDLLEQTDRPVEWIASESGFGNAAALRHHFTRVRGVSPAQYRRTFAGQSG